MIVGTIPERSLLANNPVALDKLGKLSPVGIAGTPDPHILHQTQILDLVLDPALVDLLRSLRLIWLNTPYVRRIALHELVNKLVGLGGDLFAGSGWYFASRIGRLGEQVADEGLRARLH